MKRCTKCKIEKGEPEFHKDRKEKNGLYSQCRNCHRKSRIKYRQSKLGKETQRKYQRLSKYKEYQKKYHKTHRKSEKQKKSHYEYCKNRRVTDIQFKLADSLRTRLYISLKGNAKSGSAVKDLGCTIPELIIYLEKQFKPGMTWKNWNFYGWHIDHIKPLASFDLTDREQLLQAVHYTNLQPLWAIENSEKGNRTTTMVDVGSRVNNSIVS